MNEEVKYISYEEALSVYAKMIDASDGGFDGVRDEGGIRAALEFVQNDMYYRISQINSALWYTSSALVIISMTVTNVLP